MYIYPNPPNTVRDKEFKIIFFQNVASLFYSRVNAVRTTLMCEPSWILMDRQFYRLQYCNVKDIL